MQTIKIVMAVGLMTLTLNACAGFKTDFRGKTVDRERQIHLVRGGEQSGAWQGRHLSVAYGYTIEASSMDMEGDVRFDRPKLFETFRLWVHFTTADGTFLASEFVAGAPYRKIIGSLSFHRPFKLNTRA